MAGAPPSSGFGSGLESLLGNPLIQTALAGYLGAIGSPRYKGLGGALSQGGLTGLEAFSQAEALKQKAPLLQSETERNKAETSLYGAQAKRYGGDQNAAATLMLMKDDPSVAPSARALIPSLAGGVGSGTMTMGDAIKQLSNFDLNAAKKAEAQASIAQKQALTATYPSLVQERQAAAGKSQAEAAAVPSKIKAQEAAALHSTAEAAAVPSEISLRQAERAKALATPAGAKPKQVSALDLEKQASAEAEKSWAAAGMSQHLMGDHDTYVDAFKQRWMAAHGGGVSAGPGEAASGSVAPPDATHEIVGPDGQVAGHRRADGTVQWLPGKGPKPADALGTTGITGG